LDAQRQNAGRRRCQVKSSQVKATDKNETLILCVTQTFRCTYHLQETP